MTQQRSGGGVATLSRDQVVSGTTSLTEPILFKHKSTGKFLVAHIFGEVEGMSPAYICSDEQGNESWYSVNDLQVAERKYLPPPADTWRSINSSR